VVSFKQVSLGTRIGYSGEKAEAGSSREALMFSRRVDLRGGISGFPLHVSFPSPEAQQCAPRHDQLKRSMLRQRVSAKQV